MGRPPGGPKHRRTVGTRPRGAVGVRAPSLKIQSCSAGCLGTDMAMKTDGPGSPGWNPEGSLCPGAAGGDPARLPQHLPARWRARPSALPADTLPLRDEP